MKMSQDKTPEHEQENPASETLEAEENVSEERPAQAASDAGREPPVLQAESTAEPLEADEAAEEAHDEIHQAPPSADAPARNGTGRGLGAAALLLALLALVLASWLGWQQWQRQSTPVTPPWQGPLEQVQQQLRFLKEGESRHRQQLEQLQQALEQVRQQQAGTLESLRQQQAGLKQQIDALQRADDRFQNALMQLAQLKTGGDRAQKLMEIEFLLRTAILRVELFQNRDLALRALEMASQHLAALDNPAYTRVRLQVEAEIQALKAVAMPDIAHWLGWLAEMKAQQAHWPLKAAENESGEKKTTEGGAGWWGRLQSQLSQLVSLRRVDEAPPLPASWQQASHQALVLQLSALESALTGQQPDQVQALLNDTRAWIENQFDTNDAQVKQALAELALLQQTPLQPELPPIGQSLNSFRQVVAHLSGTEESAGPVDEAEAPQP